ncbi:hypothetical protein HanPSC8_Chr13g0592831 [Helianthus annuus]|nr:hypothetical protein HanPSC8_Chr13g0592831 [Helianthus annuus]
MKDKMVIQQDVEKTLNAQCTNVKAQENTKPFTLYTDLHLPSIFFNFLTRIYIWTVHLTSHGSPIAFSLIPHTSHKTTSDLLSLSSLSLSLSAIYHQIRLNLSPDPFDEQI